MIGMKHTRRVGNLAGAAALAAGWVIAATASATTLVDQNFESTATGNLSYTGTGVPVDGSTNLARYGSNGATHAVVQDNTGPVYNYGNQTRVLRIGTNNAAGGMFVGDPVAEAVTIPTSTSFSMMGGYDYQEQLYSGIAENSQSTAGCLTFGWTALTAQTDYFTPAQPTFMVGVRHIRNGTSPTYDQSTYSLAMGTGTGGGLTTTLTGVNAAGVLLTTGHWYLLHGTVDYDSSTKKFTVDVHLDDYGIDGQTLVAANVLHGTGISGVTTFGTTGQAAFHADGGRGFGVLDNLYAESIPEPATIALLAGGLMLIGSTRRKRA